MLFSGTGPLYSRLEEELGEEYEVIQLPVEIPLEGLPEDFTVEDLMGAVQQMDLSGIEGLSEVDFSNIQFVTLNEDGKLPVDELVRAAENLNEAAGDDSSEEKTSKEESSDGEETVTA